MNGRELDALPAQRLRCALLVFLAVEGETTREAVLETFWPDRPVERGRHAFSQTLYELRRLLGNDWVEVRGEHVAVHGIIVDANELENAVTQGDAQAAVRLYAGPFLDGFTLDLKAFEAWAERRRTQLGRLHRKASRTWIAALIQDGDTPAALEACRRWAELDPLEDEAQHRYLELLALAGHRAEALRVYDDYERLLQEELQVGPLDETKQLVARLRAGEREGAPALEPSVLQSPVASALLPAEAPSGEASSPEVSSPAPPALRLARGTRSGRRMLARRGLWFALGLTVAFAAAWLAAGRLRSGSSDVNEGLVAVLPFRVAAAPGLGYLREGIVDLLASKLTGEGGLRAVDSRTALVAWRSAVGDPRQDLSRDAAVQLSRRLRAGRLLEGEIVATPGRITLLAVLVAVPGGAESARAEVSGSTDSLPALVDRLARTLLAEGAGEDRQRLADVTTTSLPALRAYLAGESAYRLGRFGEAVVELEHALDADSTFALAAIGLVYACSWSDCGNGVGDRAQHLAWVFRNRLSRRDRTFVEATVSPTIHSYRSGIVAWEKAVAEIPDRAEAWYVLGDKYLHDGAFAGYADASERARAAFERALELEPGYAPALDHLIGIYAERGDTARVRALMMRGPRPAHEDDVRKTIAFMTHDPRLLPGLLAAADTLPFWRAADLAGGLFKSGYPRWAVEHVLASIYRRAGTPTLRFLTTMGRLDIACNTGHPSELNQIYAVALPLEPEPGDAALTRLTHAPVVGDTVGNGELERVAAARPTGAITRIEQARAIWALGERRAAAGDTGRAASALEKLRALARDSIILHSRLVPIQLQGLEAEIAVMQGRPDAAGSVARLDSLLLEVGGYGEYRMEVQYLNLLSSRLHAARGEWAAGLAASRRRTEEYPALLAPLLLQEARLATRTGDRPSAVQAYNRYLGMRPDPEPGPEALQTEQARRELAALTRRAKPLHVRS